MVDIFLEVRRERLMNEAETAYDALKGEVDKARLKLVAIEKNIESHYKDNDMLFEFEKDKLQVNSWLELKTQIVNIEAKIHDTLASLDEINKQLSKENKNIIASKVIIKNSSRAQLRNQILNLKIALERTRQRYKEDSPEVREIQEQIEGLTQLWNQEEKSEESQSTQLISETYQSLFNRKNLLLSNLAGLKANIKVLKDAEKSIADKMEMIPKKSKVTHELERERTMLEKRYIGLSDKLTIAAVSKATILSAPSSIKVVDYAQYPEKPYWPKTKYLLLGAIIFGAMMGLFAAIILEVIYGRVSRYRLSSKTTSDKLYAIVARDTEFLSRLYGLKLPEK
jgi:uncharacterized protein involved in exopolysaccharide biosynthesis